MRKIYALLILLPLLFVLQGCSFLEMMEEGTDSTPKIETVKGTKVKYGVKYDSSKWRVTTSPSGDDSEYEFEHTDGDVYALIIPERLEIPRDSLKQIALQNAQSAAPDVEITSEEIFDVNGEEVLAMKFQGTIEGIKFAYYGYYYTGSVGTIQFIAYTGQNLMAEYESEITEFLNGFEVYAEEAPADAMEADEKTPDAMEEETPADAMETDDAAPDAMEKETE